MATTKKPSPAQIAARKKFAAMAKAGAFKRKAKAKATPKAAKRKANPVAHARTAADSRSASGALKLRSVKAKPRRRNPVDSMSRGAPSKAPAGYAVHRATTHGEPGPLVAKFVGKSDAVAFARDWATRNKASAVVVGKAVS